jgi:hypothetical protein
MLPKFNLDLEKENSYFDSPIIVFQQFFISAAKQMKKSPTDRNNSTDAKALLDDLAKEMLIVEQQEAVKIFLSNIFLSLPS